jgi:hypothetical protein
MAIFNGNQTVIQVNQPDINDWFNYIDTYANTAFNNASDVALDLSTPPRYTFNPNVEFEPVSSNITLQSVTKPSIPLPTFTNKQKPSGVNLNIPNIISLTKPPEYNIADPDINLPAVPSPLDIDLPVKDFVINTDFDYPVEPNITLPDVPSIIDLDIPTPTAIEIPLYEAIFPDSSLIITPGFTFSWNEDMYSDDLLVKVTQALITRLDGGTGLPPLVEEAIWNRGRDREQRAALQAEETLLKDRGSAGFSRPPGSLQAALSNVIQETQGKLITLSREIAIKQAELEQENIKTTIQQSIALEDILIREYNNIAQRRFEAAKYIQEIAIEIFKAEILKYNSQLEAYKAYSSAYTSRVQAELAKIEIFKAQIDAEKLKGDINEQNVRIYLARIDAVKSNVELYRALISAVSEKLNAEKLKLDIYRTDIDAYTAEVQAKSAEFSLYSDQIKAEMAKVDMFDSKVKAFVSRVQGYASLNDVAIKKAEIETEIESLKIKKYEADLDGYIKQVQAEQAMYAAAINLYSGEADMYRAELGYNTASAELATKNSLAVIEQNRHAADIALASAQLILKALEGSIQNMTESKKAAGGIFSQLSASALSSINVASNVSQGVSIQGQESFSTNA